jgi:hypothetical protein
MYLFSKKVKNLLASYEETGNHMNSVLELISVLREMVQIYRMKDLLYKETLFIFSPTPPAGFPDNVYIFLNRI